MGFRATYQKAEGQILEPMSGSSMGVVERKLWPLPAGPCCALTPGSPFLGTCSRESSDSSGGFAGEGWCFLGSTPKHRVWSHSHH